MTSSIPYVLELAWTVVSMSQSDEIMANGWRYPLCAMVMTSMVCCGDATTRHWVWVHGLWRRCHNHALIIWCMVLAEIPSPCVNNPEHGLWRRCHNHALVIWSLEVCGELYAAYSPAKGAWHQTRRDEEAADKAAVKTLSFGQGCHR